jgi:hypothetical protein
MGDGALTFCAGAVAAVFLVAAGAKFVWPASVESFLVRLGVPRRVAAITRRLVAPAEGVVGVWLLTGVAPVLAVSVTAMLSLIFVAVHIRALAVRAAGCNCFGAFEAEDSRLSLVRALTLALGSALLAVNVFAGGVIDPSPTSTLLGIFSGVALVAALSLAAQVIRFERERPHPRRLRSSPVRSAT